jgi:hypothetical protein
MKSLCSGRLRWVALGAVLAAVAGASAALAAYPQDSVAVYTGCLNSGGQIGSVAVGSSPSKPCGGTDTLVHLSGGTITQVSAGNGLTGGGSNGYVTLGLQSGYQLPQTGCSPGQLVASDGAGGWTCADDHTYKNGSGLDLSGNTFSVSSGYQLPQGCSSGQVATSDGSGGWTCHNSVGGLSDYTRESGPWDIGGFDFGDTESTRALCNYGDIATGGGFYNDNTDIQYSQPTYFGGSEGWYVQAHTGVFASGHFAAWVKCLHTG